MQKIDSHQHFWVYHPVKDSWITDDMAVIQKDFMPGDLYLLLQQNNIDGCVAVQADQSDEETLFLVELAKSNPFIKGVVGWVNLQAIDIGDQLKHLSNYPEIKGFRHIVEAEEDENFLLGDNFKNGISLLGKYSFSYDLLIKTKHLPAATQLVKEFPDQHFVIDHLAKPNIRDREIKDWQNGMEMIAQHRNVCCKVSGFGTEANWQHWGLSDIKPYLDTAFELFGVDRVMFGSDWPVCLLAGSYQKTVQVLDEYLKPLPLCDQEKFWAKNAIHFYGLAE